jgi:hypothetical protein
VAPGAFLALVFSALLTPRSSMLTLHGATDA